MQGDRLNTIAISWKVIELSKIRDRVQSLLLPEYLTGFLCSNFIRTIPFASFLPSFFFIVLICFIFNVVLVDRWRNGSAFDSSDGCDRKVICSNQVWFISVSLWRFLIFEKSMSIWDESQSQMMTTLSI